MSKYQIMTNKGISIGCQAKTLLNILIGANNKKTVEDEVRIIEYLNTGKERIDIITDLSLFAADDSERLWEYVLKNTDFMAGTVPVYLSVNEKGYIDESFLMESIAEQCEKGVSIITIHPTVNHKLIESCKSRMIPCTSRGGGIVAHDLLCSKKEQNAYLNILDKIIKKCKENNVVLSIGSTFRSGSILDALDETYLEELQEQIRIADYIHEKGVSSIIETPGHVDPQSLLKICERLKAVRYPIMPLGPMLTDIGMEEDDTVAVIGASMMGVNSCADILSVVTSKEHLAGIPNLEDIKKAISKYMVAKHIIDLYKIGDKSMDEVVSRKRASMKTCNAKSRDECKRCGNVCPLRVEL